MAVDNTYHYMVHNSHVPFDHSKPLGKHTCAWRILQHVPRMWYVFPDESQEILHPSGGAQISKCSYKGGGGVVSNSFFMQLEDKHGEQRKAKQAKHRRHSAKVEPTGRFCCLKGQHHGRSYNIH